MSNQICDNNSNIDLAEEYLRAKQLEIEKGQLDIKNPKLPLARIRRLMKVEEDVKNIALEVPFLYSKITEVFIEELTTRAWVFTKENRRCIIQYEDIFKAIQSTDFYDFLLYIVSRG